ncbi:MAG TPA: FAD-dependent oxidoreductase, partial [Armatimonadota bacterium]|nr:FAD-dependent oxidoreductase [Armatimonadota bacterium]
MEFTEQYDIVVVGAGVAGIAAALAAARDGFKTALVEKTIIPGGLATSGLVFVYLPLCDGNGTQVTYGISEELLKLSFRYGPGNVPTDWREKRNAHERERYSTCFSPASFVLALDETLQQAGVDIWFDTLVCATRCEDQRIKAIEVENKSGRGVINGYCFIDASGDADLAYHSGAQCAKGDNWLSIWALQTSLQSAQLAVEHHDGARLLNMFCLGGDNAGIGSPTDIPKMDGTDGKQVTKFVLEGRRLLREFYQQQHDNGGMTSRENLFPLTLPNMAQFRTTRRIVGSTTLTDNQHGR